MNETEDFTTQHATVERWTWALAQATGSPGGGAGAGLTLAVAASLASMVAGYTEPEAGYREVLDEVRKRVEKLRRSSLRLADEDAAASGSFGAAFRKQPGPERDAAIGAACVEAAKASAILGELAITSIDDFEWLAEHGNPSLISDVVVAPGALRATVAAARTNVSFDLKSMTSAGRTLEEVREGHPGLWKAVGEFSAALDRIDGIAAGVDHRAAPTDNK